jgi:predicted nucleic acid-binding protein
LSLYLDSAYVAKCYLNEPDAAAVRALVRNEELASSAFCLAEMACIFQRHVREGGLTRKQAGRLRRLFLDDVREGVWELIAVSVAVLEVVERRVQRLPRNVYLRAGDAVHLASASGAGFREIWTNDRHLLAAARYFGLAGRSV